MKNSKRLISTFVNCFLLLTATSALASQNEECVNFSGSYQVKTDHLNQWGETDLTTVNLYKNRTAGDLYYLSISSLPIGPVKITQTNCEKLQLEHAHKYQKSNVVNYIFLPVPGGYSSDKYEFKGQSTQDQNSFTVKVETTRRKGYLYSNIIMLPGMSGAPTPMFTLKDGKKVLRTRWEKLSNGDVMVTTTEIVYSKDESIKESKFGEFLLVHTGNN